MLLSIRFLIKDKLLGTRVLASDAQIDGLPVHINSVMLSKKLIEQYHLEDMVKFTGFISEDELKDYLSKSSLVIINKYPTRQNNYCFSTKLGEYLAAAKPVIMTNVGEAMNWLKNGVSAYIIEPYDVDTLSDAIENILTNPEKARGIGLAGRGVCQRSFDYRNWSKPLVDFLNQLGK